METKICRICGKIDENYVHIFKTEGLKNKIETCLPIIVVPYCLLPDTICTTCLDSVNSFYSFIKNCLQNIIVLEAQYNILESCLKTKRKVDKGVIANFSKVYSEKSVGTDNSASEKPIQKSESLTLVAYEIESDSNDEDNDNHGVVIRPEPQRKLKHFNSSSYFADSDGDIIKEITQRKRKSEISLQRCSKFPKLDIESGSRRKNKQPKKLGCHLNSLLEDSVTEEERLQAQQQVEQELLESAAENLPQVCLLCDQPFSGAATLAAHVYEMHGIDMAQVRASQPVPEQIQKRRIPDLVKIEEYQQQDSPQSYHSSLNNQSLQPPKLQASFACPLCPALFNAKPELFNHLRLAHPREAAFLCGRCMHQSSAYSQLSMHLEHCNGTPPQGKHTCRICQYSDDSAKMIEMHLQVHDFLDTRADPGDFMQSDGSASGPTCSECSAPPFCSFKEFSAHRRSQHSLFHCDLCPKFYGRNSHLWKHVNRVHKGDTAITCSLCGKTSASKYHLQQHFNKIHKAREPDFQSVMRQQMEQQQHDLLEQEAALDEKAALENATVGGSVLDWQACVDDDDDDDDEDDDKDDYKEAPKEIDTKSNLYTNIITNYTPPANEGPYKCPKCLKGFHKKPLLKKHKKNCRPRLQKDLLTRCKTCARVFKDRQSLSKHLVNYHSEYACELCGTVVQSKCEIIAHIRFSHPGSRLVCYCGQVLRCHSDLQAHQRDHAELHVCQFCGDLLPTKIKLKMHILSLHRKILSLSCGVCLRLFETQHVLRDHVRLIHARQLAPLTTCTVCGKNYGSKWKTFDHLNKSHGRIFKACKACLEVFDSEQELKEHYEAQHLKPISSKVDREASTKGERGGDHSTGAGPGTPRPDFNIKSEAMTPRRSRSPPSMPAFPQNATPPHVEAPMEVDKQQMKISLLEKRLLGRKLEEESQQQLHLQQQQLVQQQLQNLQELELQNGKSGGQTTTSAGATATKNDGDEDSDPPSSLLQNSSKRTVYENSNAPSFCEICYKTWPAKKHLWQHYIRCHKAVAATVCGICLCTNATYDALQDHLRTTHPTLLHGQGFGSNFICKICGRYHNARSKLRLHMAIHENYNVSGGRTASGGSSGASNGSNAVTAQSNGYETNGYADLDREPKDEDEDQGMEEDINFESLIEEVEMSDDEDEEDVDDGDEGEEEGDDGDEGEEVEDDDGDNEDDGDEDEGEEDEGDEDVEESTSNDSDMSDNGLEQEMLENMMGENQVVGGGQAQPCKREYDMTDVKIEYEESSEESSSYVKTESSVDELDCAIRSIAYDEQCESDGKTSPQDFEEIPSGALNQHEIQSAVDSIL